MHPTERKINQTLNFCRHGIITAVECDRLLCELESEADFLNFLQLLTPGAIEILKERSREPYASIDDVFVPTSPSATEIERFELQRRNFHARMRLRNLFTPDAPIPQYQQRVKFATVRETLELANSIAVAVSPHSYRGTVFGLPVELQHLNGTCVESQFTDAVIGKTSGGLQIVWVLAPNISSVEQVPVGTELIIVRSAHPRTV